MRDDAYFRDDANPYAAPKTRLRRDGYVASIVPAPAERAVLWVDHDLDDADVRRMPDCDFFYDPRPILGFIPQWTVLVLFILDGGTFVVLVKLRELDPRLPIPLACLIGFCVGFMALFGLHQATVRNRRTVREAGLCAGRRLTISADGLRIVIAGRPPERLFGLGEVNEPWSDYRGVEIRRGYLIFWKAGRRRLIVPERAFRSVEEASEFAATATWWIAAGS